MRFQLVYYTAYHPCYITRIVLLAKPALFASCSASTIIASKDHAQQSCMFPCCISAGDLNTKAWITYYRVQQLVLLTAIIHQWSNSWSVRPLSCDRGTAQQDSIIVPCLPAGRCSLAHTRKILTCCVIKIHLRSESCLLSMFRQAQHDSKLSSKAVPDFILKG